jgi:hypothetical protein
MISVCFRHLSDAGLHVPLHFPPDEDTNDQFVSVCDLSVPVWQFRSIFQWNINLGKHRISPCRGKNGNSHFTELDLNPHLPNINGVLELGSDYIETCTSQGGREEGSSFITFADRRQGNGNVVPTSFNVNNNVANINGELEWLNCNQLLAMDEIAAADEDVALSGRKLLNH